MNDTIRERLRLLVALAWESPLPVGPTTVGEIAVRADRIIDAWAAHTHYFDLEAGH